MFKKKSQQLLTLYNLFELNNYPFKASAPPTISNISLVIAA